MAISQEKHKQAVVNELERAPSGSVAICHKEREAGDPLWVTDGTRRRDRQQARHECRYNERNTAQKNSPNFGEFLCSFKEEIWEREGRELGES